MSDLEASLPSAEERLATWRTLIVETLTKVFAVLPIPVLLWTIRDGLRTHESGAYWLAALYFVSSVSCAFVSASLRVRARWLITNVVWVSLFGTMLAGATAGVGAIMVGATLIAVLLLGAREAGITLGVLMAGFGAWIALVASGMTARPALVLSDAGEPQNAARMVGVAGTVALAALFASAYLIRKLTRTLFEAERLIVSQRAEIQAREEETRRRKQAEQELIRAQKVEMVGRLAGGLAHDVNNNLTVALTSSELIDRIAGSDAKVRQHCMAIRDACENASSLTRQLLALGRRDMSLPQVLSIAELLERIERLLTTSLGNGVDLEISIPEDLPKVAVDARQLEQVLINLVINARDAMPDGGVLEITADHDGPSSRYVFATSPTAPEQAVRLHIRDQGSGIEPALLSQVVEPFFTTKDPEHGTGLGLAVARVFMEASGGRLGIISSPGHGSTFTLEFPAASSAADSLPPVHRAAPSLDTTVLVVDDDARVRASIASELRTAGYRVIEAEDGLAALEYARHVPRIDLLCTDAVMPRLGGVELIRRFRAISPTTRVLLCSAYVQEEELRRLVRAGRCAALSKPFSPAELRERVARVLAEPADSGLNGLALHG